MYLQHEQGDRQLQQGDEAAQRRGKDQPCDEGSPAILDQGSRVELLCRHCIPTFLPTIVKLLAEIRNTFKIATNVRIIATLSRERCTLAITIHLMFGEMMA
ncbi:hypothetical protein [Azorhizobium sp. AG788]|uniref:hypothetical protein n=1 Tax=Azorhizobium sp. AG788 TaxID=2183897 RepID=UPI00313998A4